MTAADRSRCTVQRDGSAGDRCVVLDLDNPDAEAAVALAAYGFACRLRDPARAAELHAAAGPATRSPVFYPNNEFDTTSPIVAMAAAIAECDTGITDWAGADLAGRRQHYIRLAWAAFHAQTHAGMAVLAVAEHGGVVLYSAPLIDTRPA